MKEGTACAKALQGKKRPVWLELRRKEELERWSRAKAGVGEIPQEHWEALERFCARGANMLGV